MVPGCQTMFLSPKPAQVCLCVLVLVALTYEYVYIVKMWRRPDFGYRVLLSTVVFLSICSEVERELGGEFLAQIPRIITLSIVVLFPVSEEVMFLRRKARARTRTVYVENALFEDSYV